MAKHVHLWISNSLRTPRGLIDPFPNSIGIHQSQVVALCVNYSVFKINVAYPQVIK